MRFTFEDAFAEVQSLAKDYGLTENEIKITEGENQ